jgi:hypothetical protein
MMEANITYRRHWFWKHGVMVKVPIIPPDIKPKRLEIEEGIPMAAVPGVFHPFRLVINLEMVVSQPPKNKVQDFERQVIIRVRYDQHDLDAAKEAKGKLALGFWDGTEWHRFTSKHHFRKVGWRKKDKKGWATVKLTGWDDPTIALGT